MNKLDQIRQESKEIKEKINVTEERLRQLKNQEKKILKQDIVKRRKERTHRLITRGAILESFIENAEELTDEEIKILLEEATKTTEFKETLKIMRGKQEKIKESVNNQISLRFSKGAIIHPKGWLRPAEPNPCREQQPFAF